MNLRRIVMSRGHILTGVLVLLAQLGGGMHGPDPIDQIDRSVTRPLPEAPPPSVTPSPDVWVPDRVTPDTRYGGVSIAPGHWERQLPNGRYYVPPLTSCSTGRGECATAPAGEYPPPAMR
jgi:hypothetical protein